jgi:hypothetical protein
MSDTRRFLGILMLDTRFPRLQGDAGHAQSWRMPVRFRVVRGASPQRVVRDNDPTLLQPFIDAAQRFVAEGAAAITTGCGFLLRFQSALQAALPVPVWTSSLLALPALRAPGVITVDAHSLGPIGGVPVEGLAAGCALQRTLLDDLPALDAPAAEAQTVAAATRLLQRHPEVEALVFECTNLPPYADAVQSATGRPVHHLMTFVHERWDALP